MRKGRDEFGFLSISVGVSPFTEGCPVEGGMGAGREG
jgi:hypothetical protein